jgi:hypothetical protein
MLNCRDFEYILKKFRKNPTVQQVNSTDKKTIKKVYALLPEFSGSCSLMFCCDIEPWQQYIKGA